MREETGLAVELLGPVETWFGQHVGHSLLSINYLARALPGEVRLSDEHRDFAWVSYEMLKKGHPVSLDPAAGFRLENYRRAWEALQQIR